MPGIRPPPRWAQAQNRQGVRGQGPNAPMQMQGQRPPTLAIGVIATNGQQFNGSVPGLVPSAPAPSYNYWDAAMRTGPPQMHGMRPPPGWSQVQFRGQGPNAGIAPMQMQGQVRPPIRDGTAGHGQQLNATNANEAVLAHVPSAPNAATRRTGPRQRAGPRALVPILEPLTASVLGAAHPIDQKQMIGERLYPLIQEKYPIVAGKITGMLLEMDNGELLRLLEDRDGLNLRVEEAMAVLTMYASR